MNSEVAFNHIEAMLGSEYFQQLRRHYQQKEVIEYFDDFLRFSNTHGALVLDAGCGIGYLSRRLELCGNRVMGVDMNSHSLRHAKQESRIENPIRGSVYHVPVKSECFDAIFFLDVIEHLDNPLEALRELHRVLRPQGELLLIAPNGLIRKVMARVIKGWGDPTHVHEFTWSELREYLERAGFKVAAARAAGIPLFNKLSFRLSRKIAYGMGRAALPVASPSFWLRLKKVDASIE